MLLYQLLKDPIQLILVLPCILVSLTFHEWAHGYAAYKCGDMTAKMYGRLSLNPLAHLDPVGSVCMLLFGFGWAKPVPVNTRNFRHPKRDFAIVAIAGPLMNLLLKASAKYNRIELYTRYILLALVVLTWLPAPFSNIVDWVFFPVDWLRGVLVDAFTGFWDLIFGLIWKL